MIDETSNPGTAEGQQTSSSAAFCQNCGKPLTKDSARVVGSSVYCEPCLSARLHGVPVGAGVPPGSVPPVGSNAWANPVWPPSGIAPSTPNPGLATLLGFIPGVGAMYNEQYAKGIVHLIVFAVLVSLVQANGIFLLFVFGWVFYMAFEAHHTAQARRDGTPLPNPFGLNDIGERFGFGRAWPAGTRPVPPASAAAAAAAGAATGKEGWSATSAGPAAPPAGPGWGAPVDEYAAQPHPGAQPPYESVAGASGPNYPNYAAYTRDYYAPPYYGAVPGTGAAPGSPGFNGDPMRPQGYGPYTAPPYNATYVPPVPGDAGYVPPSSRFPAGAVWLIALGTLFLLSTTGVFNGFPGGILVGFLLIGLGVWVFLRRMFETGAGLAANGAPMYSVRVMRAARGAVWLVLIGLLLLLNDFNVLGWHRSWPLFIIVAGVMALLERAAWSNTPYPPTAPPAVSDAAQPGAGSSMSVVPARHESDEHESGKGEQ